MISPVFLKIILIFSAGILVTLLAVSVFLQKPQSKGKISVLGIQEEVQKQEGLLNRLTGDTFNSIASVVLENPVLAPFLEAKTDVEKAVNTVISLPEEQKSVLCKQICSDNSQ